MVSLESNWKRMVSCSNYSYLSRIQPIIFYILSVLYILSHFIVFIFIVETVQMWFFHLILMLRRSVLLAHVRLSLSSFIHLLCTLASLHFIAWCVDLLCFLLFFPKATPTCYCSSHCNSSGKTRVCSNKIIASNINAFEG